MDLLEYYDFYSLFRSFFSLNARFNAILARCHSGVDLDRIAPLDFIHFLAHILPHIKPDHIQSFRVRNAHQTYCLSHDRSRVYFTQIRSLHLSNIPLDITRNLVESVHFYRLEYVSLDQDEHENNEYNWCSKHFLDSSRYYWLKTYKDREGYLADGTSILPLEYMKINGTSSSILMNLLSRSPRLKYVQTTICGYDNVPSLQKHTNDILTRLHLTFEFYGSISNIIVDIFEQVPRLQVLHVTKNHGSDHGEYVSVNPHWWENVLRKYLPELKQLNLHLFSWDQNPPRNPNWPVGLEEHTVHEQIEKSLYWRAHKWQLNYKKYHPTVQSIYHEVLFEVS